MSKKLIIVGTGPFGQLARDYFEEFTDYSVVAFSCHQSYKKTDILFGLPLTSVENLEETYCPSQFYVFVAIGYTNMNRIRENVYTEMKQKGYAFASFVHPNIQIWPSTTIGENVFIFENNTVQPYTKIGNNTVLWSGNHVGHHSVIGANCFISSHVVISGQCKIEENVFIGVNATLHDSVKIASFAMIGSDVSVHKDVPNKGVLINSATKLFPKNSDRIGV